MTPQMGGRPKQVPDMIVKTVVNMRLAGQSLAAIASAMNAAGYRTPSGRELWNRRMVFDLLHTRHVQQYLERMTIP
jgi:hypothetical protein